ncbi:MAG TPA: glycosyltransferase family 39 protein [Blastocatellia bacterium]|nr:glycosyltransferase family 39 protein [Blastocatellia bacterium]
MIKVFLALLFISFLLRISYSGHLFQDDGLWFTAAEEILRGRALYSEIYFDKPPAIALLYAGLFKAFGPHILTIRLFTILYVAVVSVVLYLFGSWLYERRAGLIAAAMFTLFSTTYTTGHVQGLNTDLLMALPYTAGAYALVRSRSQKQRGRRAWLALSGGALAGVAFQVNPKGAFDLVFFAALLAPALAAGREPLKRRGALVLLLAAAAGFAAGAAPFWIYIAANNALTAYKDFVWDWGARYAGYYSIRDTAVSALRQTASYFALNITLLIALVFVIGSAAAHLRRKRAEQDGAKPAPEADCAASWTLDADLTALLWLGVSYLGMSVGGRFFGHYFIQIMPALCLIGARGLTGIVEALNARQSLPRGRLIRRSALALIALGFVFTMVRFHGHTVALALDRIRGTTGEMTARWFHERLKREELMAAAVVREWPGGVVEAERVGVESIRRGGPRDRGGDGPEDYLFVWGYRPEIYYWSGLLPASRYLSTQPLTGVAADVHYFQGSHGYLLGESETAAARAELLAELEQTRPKYIIDELGFFNSALSIQSYSEMRAFMKKYRLLGATGRFLIYRRKNKAK